MVHETVVMVQTLAKDTITFNSWIGIFLYWVPVVVCAIGYILRTLKNAASDVMAREEYIKAKKANPMDYASYNPTETVGTVLGRIFVTFIPVANLWAAVVDVCPSLLSRIFEVLEKVFCQPLVPRPKI